MTAYSHWPTPTASMHTGATTRKTAKRYPGRGSNLPEAAQLAAIGDPRYWIPDGNTVFVFDENDNPLLVCRHCLEPHEDWHGPLNPDWTEWLMGFPAGWTFIPPND
ncbi:MAG: hypothetical protein RI554_11395 [Trueperaceae bacterium]|nr:hypothetical protein [Trueperaceae bacterium]